MYSLNNLSEDSFERKPKKRLGRGRGSKLGKTSGRGHNGRSSRSGSNLKLGHEGGRKPLYLTLPIKGRTKRKWNKSAQIVNLSSVFGYCSDAEIINEEVLRERKIVSGEFNGIKLLGNIHDDFSKGSVKKVSVKAVSSGAKSILEREGIEIEIL